MNSDPVFNYILLFNVLSCLCFCFRWCPFCSMATLHLQVRVLSMKPSIWAICPPTAHMALCMWWSTTRYMCTNQPVCDITCQHDASDVVLIPLCVSFLDRFHHRSPYGTLLSVSYWRCPCGQCPHIPRQRWWSWSCNVRVQRGRRVESHLPQRCGGGPGEW